MIMMMITTQIGMRALLTEAHAMTARDWRVLPSSSSAPSSLLSMSPPLSQSPSLPLPISGWSLFVFVVFLFIIRWHQSHGTRVWLRRKVSFCSSHCVSVNNQMFPTPGKLRVGYYLDDGIFPPTPGVVRRHFLKLTRVAQQGLLNNGCPTGASCPRGCGPSQEGWTPGFLKHLLDWIESMHLRLRPGNRRTCQRFSMCLFNFCSRTRAFTF